MAEQALGYVYHPRAVVRTRDSQVEPDLQVRQPQADRKARWEDAPVPILIVEILSPYSRQRDREQKRAFYLEHGVPEYWIVDPEELAITVIRPGHADRVERQRIASSPAGASRALAFEIATIF